MKSVSNEIYDLYELSMSIGNSLDIHETCSSFITTLIDVKKYSYAGIWINRGHHHDRLYSFPKAMNNRKIFMNTSLPGNDQDIAFYSQDDAPHLFDEGQSEGTTGLAIFLQELGFIKIYKPKSLGDFQRSELSQLSDILTKFIHYLRACISFHEVQGEIKKRKEIEQDLIEAKINAESASRMKSSFLANMSHEIRTPLNAIIGLTSLIPSEKNTGTQQRYLGNISSAANQLLDIVNDILDFTEIESNNEGLRENAFYMMDLMTNLEEALAPLAKKDNVNLKFSYNEESIAFTADSEKLLKILLQLGSNSIKFSKGGKVHIEQNLFLVDNTTYAKFTVSDNGIGFDVSKMDELYSPFTQADQSDTKKYEGTGLGLSIVKQCVRVLGGHIDVDSSLGRGTKFTISIPVKHTVTRKEHPLQPLMHDLKGARVLVAEDNNLNQIVIEEILTNANAEVTIVGNGAEALSEISQNTYDAIIMDCRMPVLDGYRATLELRNRGYQKPILALTAHALVTEREKCLNAGMDDYLTKPIHKDLLVERLKILIEEKNHLRKLSISSGGSKRINKS